MKLQIDTKQIYNACDDAISGFTDSADCEFGLTDLEQSFLIYSSKIEGMRSLLFPDYSQYFDGQLRVLNLAYELSKKRIQSLPGDLGRPSAQSSVAVGQGGN